MKSQDLIAWRREMGFTQDKASNMLDIGRRTLAAWEAGEREIPSAYGLACAAIKARLPAYRAELKLQKIPIYQHDGLFLSFTEKPFTPMSFRLQPESKEGTRSKLVGYIVAPATARFVSSPGGEGELHLEDGSHAEDINTALRAAMDNSWSLSWEPAPTDLIEDGKPAMSKAE